MRIYSVLGWLLLALMFGVAAWQGESATNYSARNMTDFAVKLNTELVKLKKQIPVEQHFYAAVEKALLKPGYTITDLLILGEETLKPEFIGEYKRFGMEPLSHLAHVHKTEENYIYVVGGTVMQGIGEQNGSDVVVYQPVDPMIADKIDNSTTQRNFQTKLAKINDNDIKLVVGYYFKEES